VSCHIEHGGLRSRQRRLRARRLAAFGSDFIQPADYGPVEIAGGFAINF
jgi:hypothetical protein